MVQMEVCDLCEDRVARRHAIEFLHNMYEDGEVKDSEEEIFVCDDCAKYEFTSKDDNGVPCKKSRLTGYRREYVKNDDDKWVLNFRKYTTDQLVKLGEPI